MTYRYGATLRPVSHATVPPGYLAVEPVPNCPEAQPLARHGVVTYGHALSDQQVAAFELIPFLDRDGVDRAAAAICEELREYRDDYLVMVGEDPQSFRVAVMDALRRAYPGGVHVGRREDFVARTLVLLTHAALPEAA